MYQKQNEIEMKKVLSLLLGLITLFFASCSDDDEKPVQDQVDEQEVITKLVYTLTEQGDSSKTVVFTVVAADGGELSSHEHEEGEEDKEKEDGEDGEEHEEVEVDVDQEGTLKSNTVYDAVIRLFNGEEDVIATEIINEKETHQFFFETEGGITIQYADEDANDLPVGIETTVVTGALNDPHIHIQLLHELDKTAEGVEEGDPQKAGGDTDIEVEIENIEVE